MTSIDIKEHIDCIYDIATTYGRPSGKSYILYVGGKYATEIKTSAKYKAFIVKLADGTSTSYDSTDANIDANELLTIYNEVIEL